MGFARKHAALAAAGIAAVRLDSAALAAAHSEFRVYPVTASGLAAPWLGFGNRLFRPCRVDKEEEHRRVRTFAAATSKPVYYIEPIVHGYAVKPLGLARRVDTDHPKGSNSPCRSSAVRLTPLPACSANSASASSCLRACMAEIFSSTVPTVSSL